MGHGNTIHSDPKPETTQMHADQTRPGTAHSPDEWPSPSCYGTDEPHIRAVEPKALDPRENIAQGSVYGHSVKPAKNQSTLFEAEAALIGVAFRDQKGAQGGGGGDPPGFT